MNGKDKWFVRFRGHTLGPISTEQILASIQKKEIGAADKIALASDPVWKEIQSQESFQSLFPKTSFDSLPSPTQVLFRKKKVEIPEYTPPPPIPSATGPIEEVIDSPKPVRKYSGPEKAIAPKQKSKAKTSRKKVSKKEKKKIVASSPILEPKFEKVEEKIEAIAEAKFEAKIELKLEPKVEEKAPVAETLAKPISLIEEKNREASKIGVSNILESFPTRPEIQPFSKLEQQEMIETFSFLDSLRDWSKSEHANKARNLEPKISTISSPPLKREVEIKLTLSKPWLAAMGFVVIIIIGAILFWNLEENKKRDLKNFHPSDPSSPTIQPSKQDDPIPELKAPTRPKRD
jgi:hypothetical protein